MSGIVSNQIKVQYSLWKLTTYSTLCTIFSSAKFIKILINILYIEIKA